MSRIPLSQISYAQIILIIYQQFFQTCFGDIGKFYFRFG